MLKPRRAKYSVVLLALLMLLTSCASGDSETVEGKSPANTSAVRLTDSRNLMATVQQVEAEFQNNSAATLFDADSDTLRAKSTENGVHLSAHWDEAAWTVYFAVYAESGQMLGAAVAPDGRTECEAEIACDANQASVAKMFRLNQEARPVLPAMVVSLESEEAESMLTLTVEDQVLTVKWEDNASVVALRELAKQNPVTVQMSPYGGFEQVGALGTSLPRDDTQITTDAGDIVLYQGNQIVIFHGSNSWAYTRLGKISGLSRQELQNLLDGDGVKAVFSLLSEKGGIV